MKANCNLILIYIKTLQNEETGERQISVSSKCSILCEKSLVGMSTYWNATANNVKLSCTFIVRKNSYHNEKYAYTNGLLYEINNSGKSSKTNEIMLNAVEINNTELKGMIENAMGIV